MNRSWLVAGLLVVSAFTLALPRAVSAMGAIVLHPGDIPDCQFEPGDVPGVNVAFPAQCTLIITPSGNTQIIARGRLPAGFSLANTFVGKLPCFGETGRVVATTSGQVTATCHFK